MIEQLINTPIFRRYFPPFAGVVLCALFVSLGFWQLDRAAEKQSLLAKFQGDGNYVRVNDYTSLDEFSPIQLDGEYLPDRQILIENIVLDGQIGYYVITPFAANSADPLLLVNRGWLPKLKSIGDLPDIDVENKFRTVRGMAGRLPRVAIRPGDAFEHDNGWPRTAVYPNQDEIARVLDAELLPIVLLLAGNEADGYERRWQPNLSGPRTHYGYAFQWFAMAITVVALLLWHLRKRHNRD